MASVILLNPEQRLAEKEYSINGFFFRHIPTAEMSVLSKLVEALSIWGL